MSMEAGSVEKKVLEILCGHLMVDFEKTQKDLEKKKDLDIVKDLGADPIDDIPELFFKFEQEFVIDFLNDEVKGNTRLSQIVNLIQQKQKLPE